MSAKTNVTPVERPDGRVHASHPEVIFLCEAFTRPRVMHRLAKVGVNQFEGELAEAVTHGRRAEFGRFARIADPAVRDSLPDPDAASGFVASKLDWGAREREPHAAWLALYSDLLCRRHAGLAPRLAGALPGDVVYARHAVADTALAPWSVRVTLEQT